MKQTNWMMRYQLLKMTLVTGLYITFWRRNLWWWDLLNFQVFCVRFFLVSAPQPSDSIAETTVHLLEGSHWGPWLFLKIERSELFSLSVLFIIHLQQVSSIPFLSDAPHKWFTFIQFLEVYYISCHTKTFYLFFMKKVKIL